MFASVRAAGVAAVLGAGLITASISGASPSLTVTQYRAHAASICESANRALNSQKLHGSLSQKIIQGTEFAEKTARSVYTDLRRLTPPPQLARAHAEMLADSLVLLAAFPTEVEAAKIGPAAFAAASAKAAARNTKVGNRVAALWTKLGVPVCNK
jgi:hypothetical protein